MNDPIFISSCAILFVGAFAIGFFLLWLERRSKPRNDHPAPGE